MKKISIQILPFTFFLLAACNSNPVKPNNENTTSTMPSATIPGNTVPVPSDTTNSVTVSSPVTTPRDSMISTATDQKQTVPTQGAAPGNQRPPVIRTHEPIQVPMTLTPTAKGMNPPHGAPGHDCSIPVGSPLKK